LPSGRRHSFVVPDEGRSRVSTRGGDLASSVARLLDLATHVVHSFVVPD
jgi:hypothetical protein